jgi:cell filamentation protein
MSGSEYLYKYNEYNDIYCYENTNVLINKFDIHDPILLNNAERQITALKIAEFEKSPVSGKLDLPYLKKIHKFIFEDIYNWAGEIREGDFLIKGDSIFCRAMYIESMAADIYNKLKSEAFLKNLNKSDFISRLAFYMGEINALHPFREGNGRTARIYFRQLCKNAGYQLNFHKIKKEDLIKADIMAFSRDYTLLETLLDRAITRDK